MAKITVGGKLYVFSALRQWNNYKVQKSDSYTIYSHCPSPTVNPYQKQEGPSVQEVGHRQGLQIWRTGTDRACKYGGQEQTGPADMEDRHRQGLQIWRTGTDRTCKYGGQAQKGPANMEALKPSGKRYPL